MILFFTGCSADDTHVLHHNKLMSGIALLIFDGSVMFPPHYLMNVIIKNLGHNFSVQLCPLSKEVLILNTSLNTCVTLEDQCF